MPNIDNDSLSVCIQALQKAIRHNEFLSQSATVDSDDFEESSYMYELQLGKLCKIYKLEEKNGNVAIPLAQLLHSPFDKLEANS